MANRIQAGSLVCMGRRVVKGQGIVLERVKNINDYAEFDLSGAWLQLYDKTHKDYHFNYEKSYGILWQLRSDMTQAIREEISEQNPNIDDTLIKEFFIWNTAFGHQKGGTKIIQPKVDFCLVRWMKAPSDYGPVASNYHKNRTMWTCSKLIKSI
tara:strand:- start:147 stop:608 length:462 start_codon:yes stop_codon:yes gene_type:complete